MRARGVAAGSWCGTLNPKPPRSRWGHANGAAGPCLPTSGACMPNRLDLRSTTVLPAMPNSLLRHVLLLPPSFLLSTNRCCTVRNCFGPA